MIFSHYRAFVIIMLTVIGIGLLWELYTESSPKLYIIDNSLSMAVEDVLSNGAYISRLDAVLETLGKEIPQLSSQFGIITYAGRPSVIIPLSHSMRGYSTVISQIGIDSTLGGSDIISAIALARSLYHDIPVNVEIYTDGGSTSVTDIGEIPRHWNITYITVGTRQGGAIPIGIRSDGKKVYKYASGNLLRVGRDDEFITLLRDKTGGKMMNISEKKTTPSNNSFYLPISLLLIFFGFFFHPYVYEKSLEP